MKAAGHHHCGRNAAADAEEKLRANSRKITGARQAILETLRSHPHPLTNKEIFSNLPKGNCDLATIYRSIHLLEEMGLVKRFDFGDGVARRSPPHIQRRAIPRGRDGLRRASG